jgi:hypothetical protein
VGLSWAAAAIEKLAKGEATTVTPRGHSMKPRVESGQMVALRPLKPGEPQKGDVVLVKINGRVYLHKVLSRDGDRVQIGNNRGRVNGWTTTAHVYGRALI